MLKKILALFLAILILLLPVQVSAEELQGKVTSLELDQRSPYAGILLDPIAASRMIVNQKYLRSEIELELRKEFQKDLADKRMAYNLLRVEHNSLSKLHEDLITIKNTQIQQLQTALKDEISDDHTEWWVFGGVAIGIALSIAAFYASVQITK
tara:strand:+ start:721 stop:1179 length:459 start_codon:yes stop_codon:yes gene_type:complete